MSEDLHDIDKLFKDGLDGHLEDLPPSVWEGVSHDLDKKQAVLFRDKYYRLKRAAILFLLFVFVGGAGVLYYTIRKKDSSNATVINVSTVTTNKNEQSERSSQEIPGNKTNVVIQSPVENKNKSNTTFVDSSNKTSSTIADERTVNREKAGSKKTGENIATDKLHDESHTPNNNYIAPHTDKNVVSKSNSKTANRTGKTIAAFSESKDQRGLYVKNRTRTQKQATVNDGVTGKINLPIKDINSERKMEPFAHHTFPPIDIKQLSAQHINVAETTTKTSAKSAAKLPHGFYLTAFFAPNISFDRLEDDDRFAGPGRNRNEVRKGEHSSTSFSSGLLVSYELSKKITLQSGVSITSSSNSISPKTIYAGPDNNGHTAFELHCSSGYSFITPKTGTPPAVGDSVAMLGSTSKLTYINVPASASLTIKKGRFSFHPGLGVGINFLTSGKTETALQGHEQALSNITGLKPVYVDGLIGVGADYELNKKISIGINPSVRLALTPINKETPVKSYQNYLSLQAGIKIKL